MRIMVKLILFTVKSFERKLVWRHTHREQILNANHRQFYEKVSEQWSLRTHLLSLLSEDEETNCTKGFIFFARDLAAFTGTADDCGLFAEVRHIADVRLASLTAEPQLSSRETFDRIFFSTLFVVGLFWRFLGTSDPAETWSSITGTSGPVPTAVTGGPASPSTTFFLARGLVRFFFGEILAASLRETLGLSTGAMIRCDILWTVIRNASACDRFNGLTPYDSNFLCSFVSDNLSSFFL